MTRSAQSPEPTAARRGRPPKGAFRLSREAIVEATLEVIDADGVAAVSMRAVGRVLGVDAKSLYNYVDGKDGLLDAVAEALLGGIDLPAPTGDLGNDLRRIALAFRTQALAHPEAAALVLTRQLSSFEGLAPVEAVLRILSEAGFDPAESVHLLRTFVAAVVGALLREVSAGPTYGATNPELVAERVRVLRGSGLANVTAAAEELARFDGQAEYRYAIDFAIETVLARVSS
ncbi:TetR family transcriptional regulator [Rhodococcus sp. NPDC060086]|uniref:TetR family transcriptional regulator n=1 Tax=Rhodococcus sp. NPDC060086 TaxID=3347055 RepID=UPI0036683737